QVKCDYVWKRTDAWINFPWSTEPPIITKTSQKTVLDA
ncbi:MAG: phosphoribosyltransferase, partial [Actinomycetia bacterium]|nr:phosphoribosyltransferase [Actinomycetes bacterium]